MSGTKKSPEQKKAEAEALAQKLAIARDPIKAEGYRPANTTATPKQALAPNLEAGTDLITWRGGCATVYAGFLYNAGLVLTDRTEAEYRAKGSGAPIRKPYLDRAKVAVRSLLERYPNKNPFSASTNPMKRIAHLFGSNAKIGRDFNAPTRALADISKQIDPAHIRTMLEAYPEAERAKLVEAIG